MIPSTFFPSEAVPAKRFWRAARTLLAFAFIGSASMATISVQLGRSTPWLYIPVGCAIFATGHVVVMRFGWCWPWRLVIVQVFLAPALAASLLLLVVAIADADGRQVVMTCCAVAALPFAVVGAMRRR
jgi:hypothetical protein